MSKQPKRFVISSDGHDFTGRIDDQSIVGIYLDTYDEAASYPDAKYVLDVDVRMSLLARRVESLKNVGDLLWPKSRIRVEALPVSA